MAQQLVSIVRTLSPRFRRSALAVAAMAASGESVELDLADGFLAERAVQPRNRAAHLAVPLLRY
jgi:hypothetical protein